MHVFQNVPPALLLRFLREHRSEWADNNIDAYAAAAVKLDPCNLPGTRVGNFGGQVILPLAHTIEHEEVSYITAFMVLKRVVGETGQIMFGLAYTGTFFVVHFF